MKFQCTAVHLETIRKNDQENWGETIHVFTFKPLGKSPISEHGGYTILQRESVDMIVTPGQPFPSVGDIYELTKADQ